jgi:hypothetical protein
MLKGAELLAKVKELEGSNKSQMARGCGYVTAKADGSEQVNFTAFYEALLDAKGLTITHGSTAKCGRELSYKAKVQFNDKLQISEGHMQQMGTEPGDEFEIKVGRKRIVLTYAGE